MTATTVAPAPKLGLFDRALSWLRQGTTQAGLQAIGLSVLGYASGAAPLWTVAVAVPVGLVGMLWPENASMQREARVLATDAVQAVARADPKVGAALGVKPDLAALRNAGALALAFALMAGLAACGGVSAGTQATVAGYAVTAQDLSAAAALIVASLPGANPATVRDVMAANAELQAVAGTLAATRPGTPAYAEAAAALLAAYVTAAQAAP